MDETKQTIDISGGISPEAENHLRFTNVIRTLKKLERVDEAAKLVQSFSQETNLQRQANLLSEYNGILA